MSVGIQEIVTSTLQEKETRRDALTDQYSVLVSPYGKPEFETFTVQSVLVQSVLVQSVLVQSVLVQ